MSLIQWLLLAIGGVIVLLCWLQRELDAPADQPFRVGFGPFARSVILVGYAVCALMAPLACLTGVPAAAWAMSIFALGFALLAPGPFLCVIRYGEDGLTLRSWFGAVHALRWEDILSVPTCNSDAMTLHTTAGRFALNPGMMGCGEFVCYARARCGREDTAGTAS